MRRNRVVARACTRETEITCAHCCGKLHRCVSTDESTTVDELQVCYSQSGLELWTRGCSRWGYRAPTLADPACWDGTDDDGAYLNPECQVECCW